MALITPENTIFAVLSFEGPDVYSQAGGLGVRATELSRSLAESGFETHLFFIGDPSSAAKEYHYDGKLTFHRWC
ncbi:MAG: glycosyl transferase family 1, partial [Vulcanimicrobiota bacterium]